MRTAASLGWRALPECPICGRAVRRATFDANGGTCTDCRPVVEDLAVPEAVQLDLVQWQVLVARRGAEERQRAADRERRRQERRRRG